MYYDITGKFARYLSFQHYWHAVCISSILIACKLCKGGGWGQLDIQFFEYSTTWVFDVGAPSPSPYTYQLLFVFFLL